VALYHALLLYIQLLRVQFPEVPAMPKTATSNEAHKHPTSPLLAWPWISTAAVHHTYCGMCATSCTSVR